MPRPKKIVSPKVSSLAINTEVSEKLELFCKENNITKKDFVPLALSYFTRTGVNIRSNDVVNDLNDMKEHIDAIHKLQADAALKLTGIQQMAFSLNEIKDNTTKILEENTQKKRPWWKR